MKTILFLLIFIPLFVLLAEDDMSDDTSSETEVEKPVETIDETKLKVIPSEEFSEKQQQRRISWKYLRGANLIYDCKKRHFACVNNDNFEVCKEEREESFRLNKTVLACAPLKTYKDIGECEKEQKELVAKVPSKKFCVNHRKKIID